MITAFIYRYPHPTIPDRFLYVGQERKLGSRHYHHKIGETSFGKRFAKLFPNTQLPTPIRRKIEVEHVIDINEEETMDMFLFHTWRGYGGMNLRLPGAADYQNFGKLCYELKVGVHAISSERKREIGLRSGQRHVESGWAAELGRRSLESGHIFKITTQETRSKGGKIAGKIRGPQAVASGQLLSICSAGGKAGAETQRRNKTGIFNPAHFGKGGRTGAGGRRNAELGNTKRLGLLKLGPHIRWHVSRNQFNSNCKLCLAERGEQQ